MATLTNNSIAEAIYSSSLGKSSSEQEVFLKNVVKFLDKKRLLSKAPDILARLTKIINEKEGKVVAKVWSVEKLSEATKKEIAHLLSKRYAGKTVHLEEHQNESLLGGYKIEVDDEVIDLTIKDRMKKLQAHLTA